jgi:hypothetical protein
VLLLGLDGFPWRVIDETLTPTLWRLGQEGGSAPEGGRSPLPSTTYPGFASLLTGAWPDTHRVRTTVQRPGAVPGWAGASAVTIPTLLDACRDAAVPTAAVMGDQKLYRVLGIGRPDDAWPDGGRIPARASLDAHGYLTDGFVWPRLVDAIRDQRQYPLLFGHLNEADTIGHDHGPDSPEARARYHATDEVVARIVDVIRPNWQRWVVIVVSDHDMETRATDQGLDPMATPGVSDIASDWVDDGGSAWLRLRPDADPSAVERTLRAMPRLSGWHQTGDQVLLLATAGHVWRAGSIRDAGIHGGPHTRGTVALVGGGHPAVVELGRSIGSRAPELRDWAPTIAGLLGVALPAADGRDLLADRAP